ncbi:glycosyltransferase family A protein [Flammeovirga sp. OC4]|uniref:glycosyltransferase family 2 protein n=1 Tax=Flammeovirga sp. OC4 TaxID=1382345 RepID=UPI000693F86C|nr:glycosyltransferase family A protein [Flammeovirga sp. OC4]
MVSLVVPVYNASNYIKQTLISVRAQSYTDFECLIIDDGSTDNFKKLIQPILESDIRFKYYWKKNEGVSIARNFGLSNSNGRHIVFLDSDDILAENYLESRVEFLDNNIMHIGVASDVETIDWEGLALESNYKALTTYEELVNFSPNTQTCPSSYMFRTSVLLENEIFFNKDLFNTADRYFLHLVFQKGKIGYVTGAKMYYRILENSMSRKISPKLVVDYLNYIRLIGEKINMEKKDKDKYLSHFYYTVSAYAFHTKQYYKAVHSLLFSFYKSYSTTIELLKAR